MIEVPSTVFRRAILLLAASDKLSKVHKKGTYESFPNVLRMKMYECCGEESDSTRVTVLRVAACFIIRRQKDRHKAAYPPPVVDAIQPNCLSVDAAGRGFEN